MKKLFISAGVLLSAAAYSQVGINTQTPQGTLDVTAKKTDGTTAEGFIAPRLTGNQIKAADAQYGTAQKGIIIYATAAVGTSSTKTANITSEGYYYFDGSLWQKIGNSTASGWALTGNTGTAAATNFVGTTDNVDFVTRTNNTEKMRVTSTGNVGINNNAPAVNLEIGNATTNSTNPTLRLRSSGNAYGIGGILQFREDNGVYGMNLRHQTGPINGASAEGLYFNSVFNGTEATTPILMLDQISDKVGIKTTFPGTSLDVNGAITNRETAVAVAGNAATIAANTSQVQLTGAATANVAVTAPAAPNAGQRLIVYNNTTGGFPAVLNSIQVPMGQAIEFVYSNNGWRATNGGGTTSNNDWGLTGNTGTSAATNFVGTTDNVDFVTRTNNTEKMRITATGNAGIGTSTPGTSLDVNGAITNRETTVAVAGNAATIAANTSQVQLTGAATANVAVTAPAAPNAGQRLIVYNNTTGGFPAVLNSIQVPMGQAIEFVYSNSGWRATNGGAITSNNDWGLTGNTGTSAATNFVGTADNVDFVTRTNNTEKMRITATGNAGIGTSTPGTSLDVNGAITNRETTVAVAGNAATIAANTSQVQLTGAATANVAVTAPAAPNAGQRLIVYNNTTGGFPAVLNSIQVPMGQAIEFVYSNSGWRATTGGATAVAPNTNWQTNGNTGTSAATNFVGTADNVDFVTRTNNTEKMRVTNTGNVGIGITTPSAKLEIKSGTSGTSGLKFSDMTSANSPTADAATLGVDATGKVVIQSMSPVTTAFKSFNIDSTTPSNSKVAIGSLEFSYNANASSCTLGAANTFLQIRSTTTVNNLGILHNIVGTSQTGGALANSVPKTITPTFTDFPYGINCYNDGGLTFAFFSYTDRIFYRVNFHVADGDTLGGAQGYIFVELQK